MNERKGMEYLCELCVILCGVLGTIGCFLAAFPMEFYPLLFWPLLGMALALLYYLYTLPKDARRAKSLVYAIVYGVLFLLTLPLWQRALPYVITTILKVYESNSAFRFQKPSFVYYEGAMKLPTTLLFLAVCIPLGALIIRSLRCKHSYFLAFFVTLPFIGAILLFTLPPHPLFFTLLMMYYAMLAGMAGSGKHGFAWEKLRSGVLLGLCVLLVVLGVRFFQGEDTYSRDEFIEALRIELVGDQLPGGTLRVKEEEGEVDLSAQGNRIYTYRDDLMVESDEPRSMYLHAYSAAIYENNRWKQLGERRYQSGIRFMQENDLHPLAFANDSAQKGGLRESDVREVKVTNLHADDTYQYIPYYVRDDFSDYTTYQDAYVFGSEDDTTSVYQVWDERALDTLNANRLIGQYEDAFTSVYATQEVHFRRELEDIKIPNVSYYQNQAAKIQGIQSYLRSFGTYTLQPGMLPPNQDFVLYFLKYSQRGYCVHYASAAVALLRYYGVPARYACGYYVSAADFHDGVAMVKDAQAHAWAEVLDPIKGWSVLEVTPPATGGQGSSTPTQGEQQNQTTQNQEPPLQDPTQSNQTNTPTQDSPTQTQPQTDPKQGNDEKGSAVPYLPYVVLGFMGLACIPVRRYVLLARRKRRMNAHEERSALLACGEYLYRLGVDETKMDAHIHAILSEAKFSKHDLHPDQLKQVKGYVLSCQKQARQECTLPQRLYARYIRCLW